MYFNIGDIMDIPEAVLGTRATTGIPTLDQQSTNLDQFAQDIERIREILNIYPEQQISPYDRKIDHDTPSLLRILRQKQEEKIKNLRRENLLPTPIQTILDLDLFQKQVEIRCKYVGKEYKEEPRDLVGTVVDIRFSRNEGCFIIALGNVQDHRYPYANDGTLEFKIIPEFKDISILWIVNPTSDIRSTFPYST